MIGDRVIHRVIGDWGIADSDWGIAGLGDWVIRVRPLASP
jgi:hypothetical protein